MTVRTEIRFTPSLPRPGRRISRFVAIGIASTRQPSRRAPLGAEGVAR